MLLVVLLLAVLLPGLMQGQVKSEPQQALEEGNRLFREGQFEAAVEAYTRGYSPADPHPTLTYNLGATLHHLGRLPEAILWYRRADPDDLWQQENLWLARRTLGSQNLPPAGLLGQLRSFASGLHLAAISLSWLALVVLLLGSRLPRLTVVATLLGALTCVGLAAAAEHWGPRPAVLLRDCSTPNGELPAGTEAWASRLPDGRWAIAGTSTITCAENTAAWVEPPGS